MSETYLWNIFAEISVEAGDFPTGDTAGFMNIITWADSAEMAQMKIGTYFQTFNWKAVKVESAKILDDEFIPDNDEFEDMLERARINSEAIICGTFHSYKTN